MSRSQKGSKGPGYDYWKRRERYSMLCGPGPGVKRRTNRLHRRLALHHVRAGEIDAAELLNVRMRGMTPT